MCKTLLSVFNLKQVLSLILPPRLHRGHPPPPLTAEILDASLQSLLQAITHNIAQEVGKELRGEIGQLGERNDTLESKFDELVQYVQVLEEDNAIMKHLVTQLCAWSGPTDPLLLNRRLEPIREM